MSHSLHHTDAADTAKLLQELDRDSKSRSLTGGYKTAMTVLFVLYSLTMIVMALVVSGAPHPVYPPARFCGHDPLCRLP